MLAKTPSPVTGVEDRCRARADRDVTYVRRGGRSRRCRPITGTTLAEQAGRGRSQEHRRGVGIDQQVENSDDVDRRVGAEIGQTVTQIGPGRASVDAGRHSLGMGCIEGGSHDGYVVDVGTGGGLGRSGRAVAPLSLLVKTPVGVATQSVVGVPGSTVTERRSSASIVASELGSAQVAPPSVLAHNPVSVAAKIVAAEPGAWSKRRTVTTSPPGAGSRCSRPPR